MRLKKLVLLTLIFLTQLSFAQFTDDFTDGDFTANPIWSGDNGLFTVTANELNSQSSGAAAYYLSTPSTLALNAQWSFYFNMKYSTSGANFVDVYLVSDVADVTSHRIDADEQLPGNLRIVLAHGHQPQYLPLTLGELMGKRGKHAGWRAKLVVNGYRCLGTGQLGE